MNKLKRFLLERNLILKYYILIVICIYLLNLGYSFENIITIITLLYIITCIIILKDELHIFKDSHHLPDII